MSGDRSSRWTHAIGVLLVAPFYVGLYVITLLGSTMRGRRP